MSRYYKKYQTWTVKTLLILLSTTTVFPANYTGVSLHRDIQKGSVGEHTMGTKNDRDPGMFSPQIPIGKTEESLKIGVPQTAKPTITKLLISLPVLCWTAVVPVASIILINIILAYLCDQPTNKQCLINLLYRDVLTINILHVCLWSFGMFYCEYRGQIPFNETEAESIAYLNHLLTLLILAYLNAIGILRLCTVKFKQVDLLIPFLGECDEIALRNIRCGIYSVMVVVVGTEFFCSAMPPVYYPLSNGIKLHFKNLSVGSILILAFHVLLLSTCAIFHLGAKICTLQENMKMRPVMMLRQGKTNQSIHENGTNDIEHEPASNHLSRTYALIVPILPNVAMMVGLAIVIGLHFFLPPKQALGENNSTFWGLVALTIGVEGVFFPSWLIVRNRSLRSYAKKHASKLFTKLTSTIRKLPYIFFYIRRHNIITPK